MPAAEPGLQHGTLVTEAKPKSIYKTSSSATRSSYAQIGIRIAKFTKNCHTHGDEWSVWLTSILPFSQSVHCFLRGGFVCRETSGIIFGKLSTRWTSVPTSVKRFDRTSPPIFLARLFSLRQTIRP